MSFKKGDHVIVVRDGGIGGEGIGAYAKGTTGTIVGFRTDRFHGRQAIVHLDGVDKDDPLGAFVDWTLTDIEKVEGA